MGGLAIEGAGGHIFTITLRLEVGKTVGEQGAIEVFGRVDFEGWGLHTIGFDNVSAGSGQGAEVEGIDVGIALTPTGDDATCFCGKHNGIRLDPFYQLDLRVGYQADVHGTELLVYLEVQNVTNRENVEEYIYSPDFSTRQTIQGLPILPVLGLQWNF